MVVSSERRSRLQAKHDLSGSKPASKACARRARHIRVYLSGASIACESLLSISPLVERRKLCRENISDHDIY